MATLTRRIYGWQCECRGKRSNGMMDSMVVYIVGMLAVEHTCVKTRYNIEMLDVGIRGHVEMLTT